MRKDGNCARWLACGYYVLLKLSAKLLFQKKDSHSYNFKISWKLSSKSEKKSCHEYITLPALHVYELEKQAALHDM